MKFVSNTFGTKILKSSHCEKKEKWNKTKSAKRKDLVTIVPLSNLRGQCGAVQDLSGNSVFAHEREHLLGIGLSKSYTFPSAIKEGRKPSLAIWANR